MNSNKVKTSCKPGFTLIELLIVVLIIAILAAVAVPQYQVAVGKSQFMELLAIGDAIHKAEEVYYLENGTYTNEIDKLDLQLPATNHLQRVSISVSDAYLSIALQNLGAYYVHYFAHPPKANFRNRRYCRATNEIGRKICASMTKNKESYIEDGKYWLRVL